MMAVETKPFDVTELLTNEARMIAYLEEAFESGDAAFIASAIGDVARARNISAMAKDTGLTRETLYRAFSPEGNPTLATLLPVMKALGFQLAIKPVGA
jgi:probable addiction module antidote protein